MSRRRLAPAPRKPSPYSAFAAADLSSDRMWKDKGAITTHNRHAPHHLTPAPTGTGAHPHTDPPTALVQGLVVDGLCSRDKQEQRDRLEEVEIQCKE